MIEITEADHQRAEQVVRDVATKLPESWLSGRQRFVLIARIARDFAALSAELAAVKAKRDHWKAEAVWAAKEFMKERECFFQVSYMGQWEMEIAKDPDYQRAQAILKEAGGEGYER